MFYRGLQDVKDQKNTKFGNMGEVAKRRFLLLYRKSGDLLPRLRSHRLRRTGLIHCVHLEIQLLDKIRLIEGSRQNNIFRSVVY